MKGCKSAHDKYCLYVSVGVVEAKKAKIPKFMTVPSMVQPLILVKAVGKNVYRQFFNDLSDPFHKVIIYITQIYYP